MSKSQRTKGAAFERELAKIFSAYYGRPIRRNIGQARDGGNDLDVGIFVVEAKRRASLKVLRSWLAQAMKAASERAGPAASHYDHIPIVVMREDNGDEPMVLLGLPDFLYLTYGKQSFE